MLDANGNMQYVKDADGNQVIKRYKGWLIMFDEINTAPRQNLAAAYKIFLDRMVGSYKLHPRCRLMLGGNLVGQGLAGALPSPLVSRLAHITMTPELTPELRNILGDTIFAFLTNYPKYIYQETTEPNTPFPTLRTWEMLRQYELSNQTHDLKSMVGIVGQAAATSYYTYMQQAADITDLLQGVEPFPLEKSQDLLDYLQTDVVALQTHMHRFQGEWKVLASTKAQSLLVEPEMPF